MRHLLASSYFDLTSFAHRELFTEEGYVWEALNCLDDYLNALELGCIEGEVSDRAYLVNPASISIGRGTVVEPGAYIQGPCLIGPDSVVRHGAYIRGGVVTGQRVVIGHATEVKNAIFLNGAKAAHFAYVGDSILGCDVNLGAGVRLANLRCDGAEVAVRWAGGTLATGRRKLGAIVGDRAQLGCNCVANPGALIGKGVLTYPCTSISGTLPANATFKGSNFSLV
jgi:UDP-N-acetylglucosamine diphosphorylase / glucose-1-phosphate thymidylyltransferase / UDP-N-acetylgalactosamine diphosphorylase / glucosamine-1-phosphate N-acetyltransferase / galactosamine-1-phosphate N-acetyltransferase